MAFTVYIVECGDGTLYTGYTSNLERRIHAHNHLKSGAQYTRHRRPVVLVYAEEFKTLSAAMKREYEIKRLNRRQKEALAREYSESSGD